MKPKPNPPRSAPLLLALVFAWPLAGRAHGTDGAHATQRERTAAQGELLQLRIPDITVTTHSGETRGLASELVGERVVVMDFVYTSCTTVCPVVSAIMAQVQAKLGDRLGREVALLSISVDPQRDTPARLRETAASHAARAGWTWITGRQRDIDQLLKALGTYTPNFEDHPSVVMVGDGASGTWTRLYGFPEPARIVGLVEQRIAARGDRHKVAHHD